MPSRKIWILVTLASLTVGAQAQWVNYRAPGTPRTKDGKPNLSAPAPRASNGKPDLSGVWQVEPTPLDELTRIFGNVDTFSVPGDDARSFSKYLLSIFADYKHEDEPMRPEAAELFRQHAQGSGKDHPTTHCLPGGIPFTSVLPAPFKIVQTPGMTLIAYEADGTLRQVYTDGRKHPADPQPLWLGYSVGKWEADTLVVDTVGFNDKSWLDAIGHPHSEALHVVERFRRRDFGHMDVEITVDDPKMYTRPFTIKPSYGLLADSDILESFCAENEKDRLHMTSK